MLNKGSCEVRLVKAHHVLHVLSTNHDIAQLFGLTGDRAGELSQGWTRYHRALDTAAHRLKKLGEARDAGIRCSQTFRAARAAQGRITALARLIITAPADRDRLALSGRRADAVGPWRCQAELFHANLTHEDRALLTRVGVHAAELDQTAALLSQLALDHAARVATKAAARAATSAKAAAFSELADYLSLLIGMTRVLEPDHPDLPNILMMKPDARRNPKAVNQSRDPEPTVATGAHVSAASMTPDQTPPADPPPSRETGWVNVSPKKARSKNQRKAERRARGRATSKRNPQRKRRGSSQPRRDGMTLGRRP